MIAQPEVLVILAVVAVLLFVLHRLRGSLVGPAPQKGEGEGGGAATDMTFGDGCDGSGDGGGGD